MLLLALGMGCIHPAPPTLPIDPNAPITLGWRLVPGVEIDVDVQTTHTVGDDRVWRQEGWRYLVRDMDDRGGLTLEGRLTQLSGTLSHDEKAISSDALHRALRTERERLGSPGIRLHIAMDGTVSDLDASAWDDALGHSLLSLALPSTPVRPGDSWEDLAPARVVSTLLPANVGVSYASRQHFKGLIHENGRWLAQIGYEGRVIPDDDKIPALVLWGTTYWDLSRGMLRRRELVLTQPNGRSNAQAETGALTVQLEVELAH
jgi:hypothetical protein